MIGPEEQVGRFEGRVAVVTASSRGIGKAIAARLLREGASVVINARGAEQLEAALADLRPLGEVRGVVGNLVRDETPAELADAALASFGRLDHLVNTAGVNVHHGYTSEIDRAAFERIMTTNTWVPVAMTQAALAAGLGRSGPASIVNISTIGASQVQPLLGAYCASKAALDSLTRNLARELGPRGIRVNGVAPGLVRTDMAKVLWDDGQDVLEGGMLPLQRIGEPADIAAAAAFLLADDSTWITGVTLAADGGRLLVGDEPRELFGRFPTSEEITS